MIILFLWLRSNLFRTFGYIPVGNGKYGCRTYTMMNLSKNNKALDFLLKREEVEIKRVLLVHVAIA